MILVLLLAFACGDPTHLPPEPTPAPESAAASDPNALRGLLQPIDSPLPDRATLERLSATPADDLLRLAIKDESYLVRQNAARLLHHYPDHPDVVPTLVALLRDEASGPGLRVAAIDSLALLDAKHRASSRHDLFALIGHDDPALATAAIRASRDLEGATERLAVVVAAPDTHPAVARVASKALETP